jgi:hypothetical protein
MSTIFYYVNIIDITIDVYLLKYETEMPGGRLVPDKGVAGPFIAGEIKRGSFYLRS